MAVADAPREGDVRRLVSRGRPLRLRDRAPPDAPGPALRRGDSLVDPACTGGTHQDWHRGSIMGATAEQPRVEDLAG